MHESGRSSGQELARRQLLQGGLGWCVAGSLAPRPAEAAAEIDFDPEGVPQSDLLFPHANLAGEVRPTSVLLAAFFADRRPKVLRVWQPTGDSRVQRVHVERVVHPTFTGHAKVAIDGLRPGEWYQYAYFVPEGSGFRSRSLVARFRTAPLLDSLEPLRLAITACNGGMHDPHRPRPPFQYPALEQTARHPYDLFVHLGDQAYLDRVFAAGGSRAQYVQGYGSYLGSRGMRACYARAGMLATWDDHEIVDNARFRNWRATPEDLRKRSAGRAAFFDVMPIAAEGPETRLWRSFRWGRTAELIVLDCRHERDRPRTGEYLSRAQMDWLKATLEHSPCHFKVVANSVPITNLGGVFDAVRRDRWEGYAAARQELLGHIDDRRIGNVWFLAGDLHTNFVSRVRRRGGGTTSRTWEIACTGGNTCLPPRGPHVVYSRARPRAVLLALDPLQDHVQVQFIDPRTGTVDFARDLRQTLA